MLLFDKQALQALDHNKWSSAIQAALMAVVQGQNFDHFSHDEQLSASKVCKQVGMYALQVAFPAFRQVEQTSNASLVDYFQVSNAPTR